MSFLEIISIAFGLSMDAFAVSVASGGTLKGEIKWPSALKMGAFFGFFQAAMPVLGWIFGLSLKKYIESYGPLLAFFFLSFIGGKMLYDSLGKKEEPSCPCPFETCTLTLLAVATSVDAFAIGLSFSALDVAIIPSSLIIGTTTFLLSVLAVKIGVEGSKYLGKKMEVAGALTLIIIGIKMLSEYFK